MAIIYLGRNNQTKKIDNLYVGISDQSKQVIKGYIGVNGYSKLFYDRKLYPTLKDIQNLGVENSIYSITFNQNYQWDGIFKQYPIIVDQKEEGTIRRNAHGYITSASKIYLYGNCSNLFYIYGQSILYDYNHEDVWGICNLEKYFLFNYVNNISHFLGNTSSSANHYNIIGNLANCNFINIINMAYAFYGCTGLTESPQCGPNVIDMSYAYFRCNNLTGSPKSGPNVINMYNTYYDCNNITGSPVCGDKVENMVCTYYGCNNLIGSPVCGPNVINMHYTYTNCRNLTGSPACGLNVTNMKYTYYMCTNITGDPICGPNVITFDACYTECRYLGKNVNIGEKVTSAVSTYMRAGTWNEGLFLNNVYVGKYGAINLSNCFRESAVDGDIYILNNSSNITYIFNSRSQSTKIVNIHYPITESITQLHTKLSSVKITSSSETHKVIDGSYIDIRTSSGTSYNIRIYADYVES